MKTLIAILAGSLLVLSSSPQESPELKEASDLTQSVVKLFNEGKLDEALPLAKRALEIRERLLPRIDPLVATSLSYLADIYTTRRDYDAAKGVLQRLLQVQQERFGPNDVSLAPILDRLAVAHLGEKEPGKAEDAYKRSLELKEKELGPANLHVAQTLTGLATVYRAMNNFTRAAPLYKRALAIYGQLSGVNSRVFQETSDGFTCLVHETNNRDATKDLDEIWKRFAPPGSAPESPHTLLNAKALSLPRPAYPREARDRQLSGTIVVKVRIDQTGRVVHANDMCQGPPYLREAAVAAASEARFTPPTIAGRPATVEGVVVYRYVYQGGPRYMWH